MIHMRYLGSSTIETDRLILKAQTMDEQHYLWTILMLPEVNKYYLTVPKKFKDNLLDWDLQKKYYEKEMEHANDKDVFKWSIFLKETGKCIGRLSCQDKEDDSIKDSSIRDVGWFIDPLYQGQGYATEAAKAMLDFMFLKCDIKKIITAAAKENKSSWKIMEKLGFERTDKTIMIQYTFVDELVEDFEYVLTKQKYLEFINNQK